MSRRKTDWGSLLIAAAVGALILRAVDTYVWPHVVSSIRQAKLGPRLGHTTDDGFGVIAL